MTSSTPSSYNAAWVPFEDPFSGWDAAAEPAVAWVLAEAERQGTEPLLVTTQKDTQRGGPEAIVSFARRYPATTPGGEGSVRGGRRRAPGPVLAFLPDYRAMELAVLYARGSSLAVVEFPTDRLTGWAIETGAVNLLTGQPTPDHRTERQREALDRIHAYGNNGWGGRAEGAVRALQDLQRADPLDPDVIVGAMLARGHGWQSLRDLAALIEKTGPPPGAGPAAPGSRPW